MSFVKALAAAKRRGPPFDEALQSFRRIFAGNDSREKLLQMRSGRGRALRRCNARIGERALYAERRLISDHLGDGPRALDVLAVRDDLLDQTDAQRFGRAELFCRQKEAQRVAPAEFLGAANRGASEGEYSASNFQLPKADPFGRDDDVAGQRELDGER